MLEGLWVPGLSWAASHTRLESESRLALHSCESSTTAPVMQGSTHTTHNIVTRVASLPLISSAYSMCSAFYTHAKETHPHLNTACSVVELVAAVAVGTHSVGTTPPGICLPPQLFCAAFRFSSSTFFQVLEDGVTLTKSVVSSTVHTARDAATGAQQLVAKRMAEAIDLTKDIVQDSVALTKLVVNSTVNTAVNAASEAKGLVLSSGMGTMLNRTEELVDHYLPMTEEELVELAAEVRGGSPVSVTEQQQLQSYFVRLGSLSSKVRQRAYLHSLKKLHATVTNQNKTLVLSLQVESRTLTMLRILTKHLGPMYTQVVARIEGLPSHVGERIDQAISNIRQLHTSFSSAGSIQDLTSSILAQSNEKIADAHEALDSLVDHVVQNTPLNWVVGPFRPSPAATVAKAEREI
uniref:Perilipin n=1 Tax=Varanus komodoensis TaxID=61221 RepID=A0A8D2LQ30_VARKO